MRIIEQLVYKIQGDNSEFDRSIDKSETKVSKFGSVADKMLAGVTVAAITLVIKKAVEMGKELVDVASEAEETATKFGVTFRDIREEADKTAKNLSDNFGLSSQKAQQLLSDTGDLLTGFGFTQESALDLSAQVNELAVDLASFTNYSGGAEGASAALTKALLGERESVKSLGISITEADIEQLAEDKGIVGELTRQQKAMLTLEIAISQSKNAIGDFARSSDEYANQSRILEGNLQDLRVEMGKKLLPIATQIKSAFVELTGNILSNITANTELEKQTRNLTTQSINYKNVISQLEDPMSVLTEAEKARLGILKQIQAQNLEDTIYQTSRAYKESANAVKQAKVALEELEIKQSAYTLVINDLASAQERLKELTQTKNRTTQEELELSNLRTAMMDTEFQRQTEILSLTDRINKQRATAESLNKSYETSLRAISEAVADGVVNINQYALTNVGFYDAVMDNVKAIKEEKQAIEARNKAIELAQKAFTAYDVENEQVLNGIIKMSKGHEDSAYWAELNRLATEKLNEVIIANGAKTDKVNKILDNHAQGMESITNYAIALGDSYDANSEKASLLNSTIKALIDIDPKSEAVADLIAQLEALQTTTEEVTDARKIAYDKIAESRMSDKEKALKAIQEQADAFIKAGVDTVDVAKWQSEQIAKYEEEETKKIEREEEAKKKVRDNAYAEIERSKMDEYQIAVDNIEKQTQAYIDAGVSIVDAEAWKTKELAKLQEEQADKAEEEAERTRKAWEDATFSMLNSVTSIWGSINQVQANENEKEIQRIEEQNAIAIQAAKDRGASEEELAELEKSLQADLNDTKNQYAQEEAKRNKALSTLSVILDTAKAIMQIWANPLIAPWGKGVWTGLAAGAGAAQIAAINSAPVPSYDVGSIRIPETQTATVHKDEMILTAPQAEQARREGITIAPTTKTSGNSVNLVIYLDGKEIARNTIDNLNSGSVGTIKARVVK